MQFRDNKDTVPLGEMEKLVVRRESWKETEQETTPPAVLREIKLIANSHAAPDKKAKE